MLLLLLLPAFAQEGTNAHFVVFEVTAKRSGVETSDKHPNGRRWYISNTVVVPPDIRSYQLPKLVDQYFTTALVEPLKKQGIVVQYYDDGVHINDGVVYAMYSDQEVMELQKKAVAEHKEQGGNVSRGTWPAPARRTPS